MKSLTCIDFHSHILPALDHGCKTVEECCAQLALMKENGTDIAVATPHFYPHIHDVSAFASRVDHAIDQMQAAKASQAPELRIGAEVLLFPGMHKMEGLERLCIRGTNVILIELPHTIITEDHVKTIEKMQAKGLRVILAHIDQYLGKHFDIIDRLLSMGAMAQVNLTALSSRSKRKKIVRYLEETDKICAVGSDLHGKDARCYKKFVKAQKTIEKFYSDIMRRSAELLEGAEVFCAQSN